MSERNDVPKRQSTIERLNILRKGFEEQAMDLTAERNGYVQRVNAMDREINMLRRLANDINSALEIDAKQAEAESEPSVEGRFSERERF